MRREASWNLVIQGHGREPGDFDVVQLARITGEFTGAEIKALFSEAMYEAFAEDSHERRVQIP